MHVAPTTPWSRNWPLSISIEEVHDHWSEEGVGEDGEGSTWYAIAPDEGTDNGQTPTSVDVVLFASCGRYCKPIAAGFCCYIAQ